MVVAVHGDAQPDFLEQEHVGHGIAIRNRVPKLQTMFGAEPSR